MAHIIVEQAAGVAVDAGFNAGDRPLRFHRTMPGYQRTPLLEAPSLARQLGVAAVYVKDESLRMDLPSFKLLGASWASAQAVQQEWLGLEPGTVLDVAEIRDRIPDRERRALVAATDGNHGRGVARMAAMFGLQCRIYVPAGTAQARIDSIASEGATVTVVDGTYDDAIVVAAAEADEHTLVISDTSWEGYREIPTAVGQGYTTLFAEVDETLAEAGLPAPTVVAFQAGVGSFAAAGLAHYRSTPGGPRTIIVEPDTAACLLVSARAGEMTEVPGPHRSSMAGLNCGLPSELAWPVVQSSTDLFLGVPDGAAEAGMRALAEIGVVSGESGAATLGALLEAAADDQERALAGLTPEAVVLLINTEGATDPVNYERVVGAAAAVVERERDERRAAHGVVTR